MFTVGVVMLSYLAGKALIYREILCEGVPFCLQSMTTGACSQHIACVIQILVQKDDSIDFVPT